MKDKYTYPKKFAPEMHYKDPKVRENRCGNCKHSRVTNAGANIPGLECKVMAIILKDRGLTKSIKHTWDTTDPDMNYMTQVDGRYGVCDFFMKSRS